MITLSDTPIIIILIFGILIFVGMPLIILVRLLKKIHDRFEHIEKELKPNKSYKMVVLNYLLSTDKNRTEWSVLEIAESFKEFYLSKKKYLFDYSDMYKSAVPKHYKISSVCSHIKKMPLNFLSNTSDKYFILDRENDSFSLKTDVHEIWRNEKFKNLIKDRNDYVLYSYFYKKNSNL